jgi:hypothetical protein
MLIESRIAFFVLFARLAVGFVQGESNVYLGVPRSQKHLFSGEVFVCLFVCLFLGSKLFEPQQALAVRQSNKPSRRRSRARLVTGKSR